MSLCQIFCKYPVTVLLLRHAERAATPANDPPLTPDGEARAQALIDVAGKAGIKSIFTTQFARSVQTAQPLASHLGITPTVLALNDMNPQAYVQAVVAQIRAAPEKASVLVVSHTNTIPMITAALGCPAIAPIAQDEFDKLFVIEAPRRTGKARIVAARYGAA